MAGCMNQAKPEGSVTAIDSGRGASHSVLVDAAWHSVAWLGTANLIGVLLATLLLFPAGNRWLGSWSYGRWMPVHMNLQLYGWCSLPLVAFLMKIYGADRPPAAKWARTALWAWSAALIAGSISWLTGHSSGKLFLDWSGFSRVLFPLTLFFLWVLLAWSFYRHWQDGENQSLASRVIKTAGMVGLFFVPLALYWAADPSLYPPVNPDSGGPTGASQLESTLAIVAILLALPFGLTHRKASGRRWRRWCCIFFAAEVLLCLVIGRGSVSGHRPAQFLSLASVLVWVPLVPLYYGGFAWAPATRRWRLTWLCWWAVLVPTGWCLFLPGVLDRVKFTDALVGHALMAMAGFVTTLLIFVLVVLLEKDGDIFASRWAFVLWQASTAGYIVIMFVAGWIEGRHPAFNMDPGVGRNTIYSLRLILGTGMTIASLNWWWRASLLAFARSPLFSAPGSPPRMAKGVWARARAL
jgi:cytochrome c oxidase cbb3-type subunit 1